MSKCYGKVPFEGLWMETISRSLFCIIHQNKSIQFIDWNDISSGFLCDKDEQPCWISSPRSIVSCTLTERAMGLTSTPLNCFSLTASIFPSTWYSKVILCSQKKEQHALCFMHNTNRELLLGKKAWLDSSIICMPNRTGHAKLRYYPCRAQSTHANH